MALSRVDLPQPDGPRSTTNSPCSMSSESPSNRRTASKATDTSRTETAAMAHPFTAPAAMPRTNQRPETK
jgi:hypothetical protein